jgi:hypothetical protein
VFKNGAVLQAAGLLRKSKMPAGQGRAGQGGSPSQPPMVDKENDASTIRRAGIALFQGAS